METDLEASLSSDNDSIKNAESELYSVFYHNDFSDGIPENLRTKYDISLDEGGVVVSFKDSSAQKKDEILNSCGDFEASGTVHSVQKDTPMFPQSRINGIIDKSGTIKSSGKENKSVNGPKRRKTSKKHKRKKLRNELNKGKELGCFDDDSVIIIEEENVNKMSKAQVSDGVISVDESSSSSDSFIIVEDSNVKSADDVISVDRSSSSSDSFIIVEDSNIRRADKSLPGRKQACKKGKFKRERLPAAIIVSDSSGEEFEEVRGLILNTSIPRWSFDKESPERTVSYNWRETCSPSSWTPSMKRYYNKPKQLSQHRTTTGCRDDWFVMPEDLYFSSRRKEVRCHKCREAGHTSKSCFKRTTCKMCGTAGHSDSRCPGKMCLNCGEKRKDIFVAGCSKCSKDKHIQCSICQDVGHQSSLCPDVWRRFHSTVKAGDPVATCGEMKGTKKYCCNCGLQGHLYEDCFKLRWSSYPVTSSFVKNYKGESELSDQRTILLPDHVLPSSDQLRGLVDRTDLKVKLRSYRGINSLVVRGKFSLVSQLRESILTLPHPVPKKKKKNKKQKSNFIVH